MIVAIAGNLRLKLCGMLSEMVVLGAAECPTLRGKALQYVGPDSVADMIFTKIPDDKKSCRELSDWSHL